MRVDLRIDFTKYSVLALNFINLIIFSYLYGEDALVSYVFYISLCVVLNAIFDLGLNTLNCNMQLQDNVFYSFRKKLLIPAIFFLLLISIGIFFLFYKNIFIVLACFLQILPGTYIMRFLSIKRRSKEILTSIFYGELLPAIFKLAIILLLYPLSNLILTLYAISLGSLFFSLYLSKNMKIEGLNVLSSKKNINFVDFNLSGYSLSVFFSIKNQIFGIFLPALANDAQRNLFAVLSRINTLIISLFSPLVARIPLFINKNTVDIRFYVFISLLIIFSLCIGYFFWKEIINLFSIIFSSGNLILDSWAFSLFMIMLLNIAVIFISQLLIFKGKINFSFSIEAIYFTTLLYLIIYNF